MKTYKLRDDEINTICRILEHLSYGWEEYYGEEDNNNFRDYLFEIVSTLRRQQTDQILMKIEKSTANKQ